MALFDKFKKKPGIFTVEMSEKEIRDFVFWKYHLTKREAQLLRLKIDGHTTTQIAKKFNVTFSAARNRHTGINKKLNAKDINESIKLILEEEAKLKDQKS